MSMDLKKRSAVQARKKKNVTSYISDVYNYYARTQYTSHTICVFL